MLYWENEVPALGEVHHLMVLCYYLQHPTLYSPDGLQNGIELLEDFVERGLSPAEARRQNRSQVDSGSRVWKITARPGQTGNYPHPMDWKMTAVDVVAAGRDAYVESVRRWARLTRETIASG
jgi:hypothetical protein